jgi:hypothetical protein
VVAVTLEPPVPRLEPSFSVRADLGPMQDLGNTRVGHRRIVPITGGAVFGAIEGTILTGGADWQVVRTDGSVEVDGRYTIRTAEGALVYVHAVGLRSGPPAVLESLLRGAPVPPDDYYFRASITLESSELPELEQSLYLASYVREAKRVRYVAYRVT